MKPCFPGPPGILVKATCGTRGRRWLSGTPGRPCTWAVLRSSRTCHGSLSLTRTKVTLWVTLQTGSFYFRRSTFSPVPGGRQTLTGFLFLKSVSSFASRGSVAGASFTAVQPFGGLCRDHVGCGEALGGWSRAKLSPGSCSHQNLAGLLHLLASQAPLCRVMGVALP